MAVAAAPPAVRIVPGIAPGVAPSDRHLGGQTVTERPAAGSASPHEILVAAIIERSRADVAWLAWHDGTEPIVVQREAVSPLSAAAVGEFPEAPRSPLVIDRAASGPWSLWCQARGILSCVVVPVHARHRIVGTIGLASSAPGALRDDDLQRLQLVSSLALHARRYEARLAGLRRLFDEVSRTLEGALSLDRALRLPPTYREIARSVGSSLDVTYCQIAIRDSKKALTIRAAGGRRPPRGAATLTWPIANLATCAEALEKRSAVVLTFGPDGSLPEPERLALFSPTTRSGVILPFVAGPRTQGVLIVGEERQSRCQPMSAERVAILELVASRIAHIMRMSRRLEYERLAERRRERKLTVERQRLAREVHDEVGQALSGLLVQARCALTKGHAGIEELQVMERAARSAMDGARALAYGFRNLERGIGALEGARSFADTMLRAARCDLSWSEERASVTVARKTLREVSRVIKEAVTNIVRHAQAEKTRIRVEYPDGRIRVTIHDNGVGFPVHDVRPTKDGRGLGLLGSSERLARIGGVFKVTSVPGKGTSVVIDAPRAITPRPAVTT
ncbi:MAG TPA: ATP-binding protein [Candidatus Dormibacteraeota bacterium]